MTEPETKPSQKKIKEFKVGDLVEFRKPQFKYNRWSRYLYDIGIVLEIGPRVLNVYWQVLARFSKIKKYRLKRLRIPAKDKKTKPTQQDT